MVTKICVFPIKWVQHPYSVSIYLKYNKNKFQIKFYGLPSKAINSLRWCTKKKKKQKEK